MSNKQTQRPAVTIESSVIEYQNTTQHHYASDLGVALSHSQGRKDLYAVRLRSGALLHLQTESDAIKVLSGQRKS